VFHFLFDQCVEGLRPEWVYLGVLLCCEDRGVVFLCTCHLCCALVVETALSPIEGGFEVDADRGDVTVVGDT
jgi:hypothetical protein